MEEATTKKKEEEEKKCWRKEVEENVKRVQSLLFGVERALETHDSSSAYLLSLRLLGFLDSHSHEEEEEEEAFLQPIRREALSLLHSARRSLTPLSDRFAFFPTLSPIVLFVTTLYIVSL